VLDLPFLAVVALVAIVSGATASVAGFGIGSMLTPLLALRFGMDTAVAAVAIPHAFATGVRCWRLRHAIDRGVLRGFGAMSAAGGLAGALLYSRVGSETLTVVLGILLIATAIAALTNWAARVRLGHAGSMALGALSGLFGGVAGNQGGLRAAALLGFGLTPAAFVATSTAVGVVVDAARTPVYLWRAGASLAPLAAPLIVATLGVLAGTIIGERILLGLSRERFRAVIGALIGALGLWLLIRTA